MRFFKEESSIWVNTKHSGDTIFSPSNQNLSFQSRFNLEPDNFEFKEIIDSQVNFSPKEWILDKINNCISPKIARKMNGFEPKEWCLNTIEADIE